MKNKQVIKYSLAKQIKNKIPYKMFRKVSGIMPEPQKVNCTQLLPWYQRVKQYKESPPFP